MAVVQVQSSHTQIFLCDSKIYAWSRHLIKSINLKKFQKWMSEMANKKGEYCWSSKGDDKCSLSFRPGYLLVAIRTTGQIEELFNNSQHDKTEMETMSESMFTKGKRLSFLHINWVNSFNVKRCLKLLLKKKSHQLDSRGWHLWKKNLRPKIDFLLSWKSTFRVAEL